MAAASVVTVAAASSVTDLVADVYCTALRYSRIYLADLLPLPRVSLLTSNSYSRVVHGVYPAILAAALRDPSNLRNQRSLA